MSAKAATARTAGPLEAKDWANMMRKPGIWRGDCPEAAAQHKQTAREPLGPDQGMAESLGSGWGVDSCALKVAK